MDLRLLCQSLKKSPDHGSGEFAKNLTAPKYYSDKKKLVLNGIIQLDNILSSYPGDSKDVKIPLFQALGKCLCLTQNRLQYLQSLTLRFIGFSADLYYLYRVNHHLYVLNHVGWLNYPRSKKDVMSKTTELIRILLKLKVSNTAISQSVYVVLLTLLSLSLEYGEGVGRKHF